MPKHSRRSSEGVERATFSPTAPPHRRFNSYRGRDSLSGITVQKASAGRNTVALMHEPTAPYHSVQDALRILETVAGHTTGVTDTELARITGLGADRLTILLRTLRREGYVEQLTDGAYITGEALRPLRAPARPGGAGGAAVHADPC